MRSLFKLAIYVALVTAIIGAVGVVGIYFTISAVAV